VPAETLPLWSARFARPQGGELVLSEFLGRPLVLNFWATWCPPCVKEMPELDRFAQAYAGQGWQVLGLAIDNQRAVQEFLLRVPVKFHIGLAGLAGSELGRALGNERGLLPYTLLLSRDGAIVQRKFGPTDFNELSAWAKAMG
jgi:thiol-disulfide isomerase/thioredoxin